MATTVMKLGTIILCSKAFRKISVSLTFIKCHGHRGWWKMWKNSNMHIFSNTMSTKVMKHGTMVLCWKTFQTTPVLVTFIQSHGRRGWWKILKNSNMDIFSNIMSTTVIKYGTLVLCGKAFQTIPNRVTFIQSQGQKDWWEISKKLKNAHHLRL